MQNEREKSEIRNPNFKTMTKIQNQTKSKIKMQNEKEKIKENSFCILIFHFDF